MAEQVSKMWRGSFPLGVATPDGRKITSISLSAGGSSEGHRDVWLLESEGEPRHVALTDEHTIELIDGVTWFTCEFRLWDPLADGDWYLSPYVHGEVDYPKLWMAGDVSMWGEFLGVHLVRERCWEIQQPIVSVES